MNNGKIWMSVVGLLISTALVAQNADTIVTMRGKIVGHVKEITPELVAYTNPNEAVIYKIERGAVSKIVFASGRVEKFADMKVLAKINGAFDWPQVDVATTEYETKGLYKIDLISTKATGTTVYSSVTKVQDRAFSKLKMAAAIMGGNLVYIKSESLEGNIRSELGSRTSRAQLLGTAYCSELLDENKFKATLAEGNKYTLISKLGLRNNDADIHTFETANEDVDINSVQVEKGFIYLTLTIDGKKSKLQYRVVSFSDSRIMVAYREGTAYYNMVLSERM
ncbi:MAG: hypothetical protein HOP30_07245 [Cyclobacteriaceae bacterium]|nr:hypothetical protein [Cyclobacteriaceae bacterium]